MGLTFPTFDGVSFSPYWLQIGDPDSVPYSVRFSPSGVKHCSISNHTDDYQLATSGVISSAKYAQIKAKLGVEGVLTASQGSCTAILVRCEGTPVPGDSGSGGFMYAVSLAWVQVTAWT